ncbi:MAG: metallophosphoesterase [Clostridiales bacterium]|nr:metallophosphoesterase [Clostridiales bacterium]
MKIRIIIILLILIVFSVWQNNSITTTQIEISNSQIPDAFDEFTIVQISDLHNKVFRTNQSSLLKRVIEASPDIIVITGDLVDRRKYDLDDAMLFIDGAVRIAPVYFVSGNHEAWSGEYVEISKRLTSAGVVILDDMKVELKSNGEVIELLGLSDPDFLTSTYFEGTKYSSLKEHLSNLSDESVYQILLSHRPELFDLYVDHNIDLIFSGHAHGGQFRFPRAGGLIAPDQGLFPKYSSGSYKEEQSTMVVSRGLGNSIIPVRIFNRPEVVIVTLKSN